VHFVSPHPAAQTQHASNHQPPDLTQRTTIQALRSIREWQFSGHMVAEALQSCCLALHRVLLETDHAAIPLDWEIQLSQDMRVTQKNIDVAAGRQLKQGFCCTFRSLWRAKALSKKDQRNCSREIRWKLFMRSDAGFPQGAIWMKARVLSLWLNAFGCFCDDGKRRAPRLP
jgi:hypothetical protein